MAILATDNFNRANESPLAGNWSPAPSTGNLRLDANQIIGPAVAADCVTYYNAISWPNDQWSEYTITSTGGSVNAGPAVRISSSNKSGYILCTLNSIFFIFKFVDGSYTELGGVFGTNTIGDVVRLEVEGTTLRAYKNGVLQATRTDTDLTSGSAGFYASQPAISFDDWSGGDFVVAIDTSKKLPTKKRKTRRTNTSDFTGFGAFSALLSAAGLFDKDLITVIGTASSSASLQGDIGEIYGELVANVSGNSVSLQGDIGGIDGVIVANTATNSILQGVVGELSGSLVANVSEDIILQGGIGEISGSLIANVSVNVFVQGDIGEISGSINASLQSPDVILQGALDDISGSISAFTTTDISLTGDVGSISGIINAGTPTLDVVLQGAFDDVSGQLQATVVTSLLLGGDVGSLTGSINSFTATDIFISGSVGDVSGVINTSALDPLAISLGGALDGISGVLDAIVTDEAPVVDKDKGISGKKHVTYIKGKKQQEVLKLRPEEIDQQVYNLLFNEAKEVLREANVKDFGVDVLADSVVSDVLDRFNANQVEAERERVLEETRLNAYLVAVEYLNRLYREDEELLLLL